MLPASLPAKGRKPCARSLKRGTGDLGAFRGSWGHYASVHSQQRRRGEGWEIVTNKGIGGNKKRRGQ
jgi:hypothetical protein